jgi:hypothetical protein
LSNHIQRDGIRVSTRRVDLEIILPKTVDSVSFHMLSAFANSSVAPFALAALQLAERAVDSCAPTAAELSAIRDGALPFDELLAVAALLQGEIE